MSATAKKAAELHKDVPPDWYARSIRENLLQRFWHTARFREIGKIIEPTKGNILDIGSADGTFTKIILEKSGARKVYGIDVLPKSVAWTKRRFARSKKMSFRVADAHNLPFRDREFDAVYCLETLEHVEDPEKVIKEIYRVLKEGGYTVILVPSENLLFRALWPFWTMTRGRIWKGTHLNKFSADKVLKVIENEGFKIVENKKFLSGMLQAAKARKTK